MTTYLRADWGAPTPADGYTLTGPLGHIFVHHTVGPTPGSPAAALAEVLNIYRQHTSPSSSDPSKPWNDIAYSWLVDDFGNAYEGRGWLRSQAAQPGWNSKGHSICWMGNAMTRQPSTKALAAIAQVIVDGQRAAAVTSTPTILGHRDVNPTACCGDLLYAQLGVIRAAVIDLPPATIEPGDDPMTQEDKDWVSAQLTSMTDWLQGQLNAVSGNVTNNAAYLGQWMQGLAGEHRQILDRLAETGTGTAPSADEIAAAIIRQMSAK